MRRIVKASRRRKGPDWRFARTTGGGFPKSCGRGFSAKGADGVPRGSRCPAPPRHALLAQNLWPKDWGKPSLWVITKDHWYKARNGE